MKQVKTQDFEITNLTPQIGELKISNADQPYTGFDKNNLILDMGEKKKGDFATCNLLFESSVYKITSTGSSCGCTNPSFQDIEDGKQHITVVFDPSRIDRNISKVFTLYLNNDMEKKIKINLIMNK